MANKQKNLPPPPIKMQTKRLTPEQILNTANQIKDRFSAMKGRADQMMADSLSTSLNEMLQLVQRLLQERAMDESKIMELEKKIEDLQPKKKVIPPVPTPE